MLFAEKDENEEMSDSDEEYSSLVRNKDFDVNKLYREHLDTK